MNELDPCSALLAVIAALEVSFGVVIVKWYCAGFTVLNGDGM